MPVCHPVYAWLKRADTYQQRYHYQQDKVRSERRHGGSTSSDESIMRRSLFLTSILCNALNCAFSLRHQLCRLHYAIPQLVAMYTKLRRDSPITGTFSQEEKRHHKKNHKTSRSRHKNWNLLRTRIMGRAPSSGKVIIMMSSLTRPLRKRAVPFS